MIGGAGAALTARFMTALLFEVSPTDTSHIVFPLISLLLACAFAAVMPAQRAARIPPTTALAVE